MRYGKRDATMAFERLVAALGGRVAQHHADVGAYRLDLAGCYGGYVVEVITSESGAVNRPFGMARRPAREFCQAVSFALDVLAEHERGSK